MCELREHIQDDLKWFALDKKTLMFLRMKYSDEEVGKYICMIDDYLEEFDISIFDSIEDRKTKKLMISAIKLAEDKACSWAKQSLAGKGSKRGNNGLNNGLNNTFDNITLDKTILDKNELDIKELELKEFKKKEKYDPFNSKKEVKEKVNFLEKEIKSLKENK